MIMYSFYLPYSSCLNDDHHHHHHPTNPQKPLEHITTNQ